MVGTWSQARCSGATHDDGRGGRAVSKRDHDRRLDRWSPAVGCAAGGFGRRRFASGHAGERSEHQLRQQAARRRFDLRLAWLLDRAPVGRLHRTDDREHRGCNPVIDLDALARAEAGVFALETVRIAGVVIAAPLAWLSAPLRVRGALVLLLAFAAHAEGAVALHPMPFERLAFSVGSEFMLGLGIGFVVRLFVAIAEMAADHIAPMMGIGAAQLFDPQTKNMQNVLATMLRNFAVLLG